MDINQDLINWLLEEENPSIRYWTFKDILGKNDNSKDVKKVKQDIMESELVNSILNAQNPDGFWIKEEDMYLPKYTATTHQLLILAELGATRNSRIEKAIEHIYKFQRNNGHFLTKLPKTEKGKNSVVKDGCCFDGNILFYLNHFGYLEDPRTKKLLEFIYDYYDLTNTGWSCRAYPINPEAVFPVNCYMGATKILKAFSMIPEEKRDKNMNMIIKLETEKILENKIYKYRRNPDGSRKEKIGWKRFGFPLFYQADLLEVMVTLVRLNIFDNRINDALKVIKNEQQQDGKWILKNSYNSKLWKDIEVKNGPSKWITLRALYVLKKLNQF